jgi:hypothetical protein
MSDPDDFYVNATSDGEVEFGCGRKRCWWTTNVGNGWTLREFRARAEQHLKEDHASA